jgi:hypothetical protein
VRGHRIDPALEIERATGAACCATRAVIGAAQSRPSAFAAPGPTRGSAWMRQRL